MTPYSPFRLFPLFLCGFLALSIGSCSDSSGSGSPTGPNDPPGNPTDPPPPPPPLRPPLNPDLGLEETTATVVVELPPAAATSLSEARVVTAMHHSAPVQFGGAFSITAFEGGPQLAIVLNTTGDPVLLGWVDPTLPSNTLSSTSTAEVLAFFDMGGFLLLNELRGPLVGALRSRPELHPLEQAIAGALSTPPHHLGAASASLVGPRTQAVQAILTTAGQSGAPGRSVGIDPGDQRSGILVSEEGFHQLVVHNAFRRRAIAYVDQIDPPGGEIAKLDVAATHGATSVIGVITDATVDWLFQTNTGFYSGTTSDPVVVPLDPEDAERTDYRVTVIGMGAHPGALAELADSRQPQFTRLVVETLVADLLIPLVASAAVPLSTERINRFFQTMDGTGAVSDFISVVTNLYPAILERATEGDLLGAVHLMIQFIVENPAFQERVIDLVRDIVYDQSGYGGETDFDTGVETVQKFVGRFDILLAGLDAAAQVKDILSSSRVEVFDVAVIPHRINLTPEHSEVQLDEQVTLAAQIVSPPSGVPGFEYRWETSGAHGFLRTGTGQEGVEVTSSQGQVTYVPTGSTTGEDEVWVTVSAILGAGDRPRVGRSAPARVKVTDEEFEVWIVPAEQSVMSGHSVDFSVQIDPWPEDGIVLRWNTTGRHGHLVPEAGAFTGADVVTYHATSGGDGDTDEITVEVYRSTTEPPIGTASATVSLVPLVVEGGWYIDVREFMVGTVPYRCVGAKLWFPLVEGATRYEVYAYGFNDPHFYGTELRRTVRPPFPTFIPCGLDTGWGRDGTEGESYILGLAASSGAATGEDTATPFYQGRFGGMTVEVTVHFR